MKGYGSKRKLSKHFGWIVLYKHSTTDFFWTKKEAMAWLNGAECCCGIVKVKISPVSKVFEIRESK